MSKIIQLGKPKPKNLNVGIVIQARMTSKRFPGKSMALLEGVPVIAHVINRCLDMRPKTIVVVAVPDTDESEPILKFVSDNYHPTKVANFCGSEDNVLERYLGAAQYFHLDAIVRVTGDCPYVNPKISSEVIELLLDKKYDYTSNCFPDRTFPKGFDTEAFTFDCLEAAYVSWKDMEKTAKILNRSEGPKLDASYAAEHVTPFMQLHPDIRRGVVKQKMNKSDVNLCVDFPEDIARLEELCKKPDLKLVKPIGIIGKKDDKSN